MHQERLPVELVRSGRNNVVEFVALAQFLKFGIGGSIELEPSCVIALDEGQRVEARQDRAAADNGETLSLLKEFARRSETLRAGEQNRQQQERKRGEELHRTVVAV
jgi:hypothetical protein